MDVVLREAKESDAAACGRICYEAFKTIAAEHNFPPDFRSAQAATEVLSVMIRHRSFYAVVGELEGRVVGSNFLDERGPISAVGPITVDPQIQNEGLGRRLMLAVMERSDKRCSPGIRLVQAGYHRRSLALYLSLGFDVREHLSCIQGSAINQTIADFSVRPATERDAEACGRLCISAHGHHRGGELRDAILHGVATVAERGGRITGYATSIAFFGHAVAETNDDLKALISAAKSFAGQGFLLPSRNGELMRWCLGQGLRIAVPMTLMSKGLYNEPARPYLPSVHY